LLLKNSKLKSITNPPVIGTEFFDAKDLWDKLLLSNKKLFFLKNKFNKTNKKNDTNIIKADCIKIL
jgi:hypothetical protein